jgi:hypothetical protein
MDAKKEAILDALHKFARQRAGLEFGNYGDVKAFRSEQRRITNDLHQARELLRAVAWRDSITGDALEAAFSSAYSGRLTCKVTPHATVCTDSKERALASLWDVALSYCAGQYFPTEYRKAVCAVCASALWDNARKDYKTGDALRAYFKREFGPAIARRWFN